MAYCPNCNAEMAAMDTECGVCGYDFNPSDDSDDTTAGLIGDCTKHRYLAAAADNFGVIIASLLLAKQLTFVSEPVQGISAYVFYLLYFFAAEAFCGATLAKWFFGLSVVGVDRTRCTVKHSAVRTLLRIIEVNPILLGALPAAVLILLTKRKQRLGGILTGTVVARLH